MGIAVKICGLLDEISTRTAVDAGAFAVGFVFHPGSSRKITPLAAARLAGLVPSSIKRVGLFVNADDAALMDTIKTVPLDMLQLHGDETPERMAAIKAMTGKPIMAALHVSASQHLDNIVAYEDITDWLLFDARVGTDPTGGGKAFDWSLLKNRQFKKPWMLAGGLNADNIAEAVRVTGAKILDVSSGVEDIPARKSPAKIKQFIEIAAGL